MENTNQIENIKTQPPIHWGHFALILLSIILLAGFSFMQKPELFSLNKNKNLVAQENVPKYYAYQATDTPQPLVAGASTNQGPSLINEDGTISPVDIGEVLGASTQDVKLSLEDINVKTISDSPEAITTYLETVKTIANGPIDNNDFETALTSSDQNLINEQAKKLIAIRNQIQNLPAPVGLEKLAKLTIIQYDSAVGVLQNFTKADENPELVGQYLQAFLKAQQDLDLENNLVAKKYNLNQNQIVISDLPQTNESDSGISNVNSNGQ